MNIPVKEPRMLLDNADSCSRAWLEAMDTDGASLGPER